MYSKWGYIYSGIQCSKKFVIEAKQWATTLGTGSFNKGNVILKYYSWN